MVNTPGNSTGLTELVDRVLDKGLIINADIKIDIAGTEILGIKIRAALASFETAAKFGLAFPSGTNLNAPAWRQLECQPEIFCPDCGQPVFTKHEQACSCGWKKINVEQENKKLLEVHHESNHTRSRLTAN